MKKRTEKQRFIVHATNPFPFVKYILIENGEYKCFYFDGTKIISRFDKQEEKKVNSFIKKGIWKEIEPQEVALL